MKELNLHPRGLVTWLTAHVIPGRRLPQPLPGDKKPHVRMNIQPRVSHYREPLMIELLDSTTFRYDLFGIKADRGANKILSARPSVLDIVDGIRWTTLGILRWDHGVVSCIIRGAHDGYVIEGRIYTLSTWVALLWGRILGRPVFLWTHGWKRPEYGIRRRVRTTFYRLSPGLLIYGEAAKERAVEYGVDRDAIAVVGNSIYSREALEQWINKPFSGPAPETFTIIVACRLTPRHHIELLFEALNRLTDRPPVQVLVIGDGTESDRLKSRASQSRAQARFLGALYGEFELAGLYAFADLAVSPAASGLNIVQSLGFGVPVVVPDMDPSAGPEHELVLDGETGYRFRHGDVSDLADTLRKAITNRAALAALGQRGRERVLRTHVAEAHAHAIDRALAAWGVESGNQQ